MKITLLASLAVAVLFLPLASATPEVPTHAVSVIENGAELQVSEALTFRVTSTATYEDHVRFYARTGATNLQVRLSPPSGPNVTLLPAFVTRDGPAIGELEPYRANLSAAMSPLAASQSFKIEVGYRSPAASRVDLRTSYPTTQLAFTAQPGDGRTAYSSSFPDGLARIQSNVLHGGLADAPAEWTYSVAFTAAPPAAMASDLTAYVWALGGLVLGLLVFYVGSRQGWFEVTAKSKKYVKAVGEPRSVLEARRRALFAALKELEHAHEAKEIPDEAYGTLKEEYKAQTVRVMRWLEERSEGAGPGQ